MITPKYYARGRYVLTNLHGHKWQVRDAETAKRFACEMNEVLEKYLSIKNKREAV